MNEIVNFIYAKFDEYEKGRKEREQIKYLEKMYQEWSYPVQITLFSVSFSQSFLKNLYIHENEMPGDFLVNLIVLVMIL